MGWGGGPALAICSVALKMARVWDGVKDEGPEFKSGGAQDVGVWT